MDQEERTPWAPERPVYDWKPEYTEESAPTDEELEDSLFGTEDRILTGASFDEYDRIEPSFKDIPQNHKPIKNFGDANFHPTILKNIERMSLKVPTPIQKHAIPLLLDGHDMMACAQTGSGKTVAFLAPILSKLAHHISNDTEETQNRPGARITQVRPQVLIIIPTRELAIQIFDEARRLTYQTRIRPGVIYGGTDVRSQKIQLARGANVLIATPGRLIDTVERGYVGLDGVMCTILDEADRMLERGFAENLRRIFEDLDLNINRHPAFQTVMFSATFPSTMQILAKDILKDDHCCLRIGRIGGTTTDIVQNVYWVEEEGKDEEVANLLMATPPARTVIFVATKVKADYLDDKLFNMEFPCVSIHSGRDQRERENSLEAFRLGRSPILVATAVAARGLDIKDVMHVINYDLSDTIDEYVHRIGRTARAGNKGLASSFYNARNSALAPQLAKLLVECKQDVPEFLSEFVSDDYNNEVTDFVDLDQLNIDGEPPAYEKSDYMNHHNEKRGSNDHFDSNGGYKGNYHDYQSSRDHNNDNVDYKGNHLDYQSSRDHNNDNVDYKGNYNDNNSVFRDEQHDNVGYTQGSHYGYRDSQNENNSVRDRQYDNGSRAQGPQSGSWSRHGNDGYQQGQQSGYRDNHRDGRDRQYDNNDYRDRYHDNDVYGQGRPQQGYRERQD